MRIVFRVDASLQIGSGHVMRCLTLADALHGEDTCCHFVCREHSGHLLETIRARGYKVHTLPCTESVGAEVVEEYEHWLGCDWHADAMQVKEVLSGLDADWLIVDHYALDWRWERLVAAHCRALMVIDDLATRAHECTLLLDQNLGRESIDYAALVPANCTVLAGANYALLRPEFSVLREQSLAHRKQGALSQVLISLGGVDKDNATGAVLDALRPCSLPTESRLVVVMGSQAPWLNDVRQQAETMPWATEVLSDIRDMARRMTDSDLAIGAAGSTAWERCCLGLPALMIVLAENQWPGARALAASQAAWLVGEPNDIAEQLPRLIGRLMQAPAMTAMSEHASRITDGKGTSRVVAMMRTLNGSA